MCMFTAFISLVVVIIIIIIFITIIIFFFFSIHLLPGRVLSFAGGCSGG